MCRRCDIEEKCQKPVTVQTLLATRYIKSIEVVTTWISMQILIHVLKYCVSPLLTDGTLSSKVSFIISKYRYVRKRMVLEQL